MPELRDEFELARWSQAVEEDASRPVLELPLRVAGYDIDFAGIVNNGVYVRWLEDMRTAFMSRWLTFEDAVARGLAPTLVRSEIDYRAPLRLGDRVLGRMWAARVSRASAQIRSEIRRVGDERVCCAALQTVCFVDLATGRPRRFPEELRSTFLTGS